MRIPGSVTRAVSVIAIASIALVLRVSYLNHTTVDSPLRADAGQYVAYGHNLAFRHTFSRNAPSEDAVPDSYRSPGYPAWIAAAFLVGGEEDWYRVLYYSQAVLGALLVVITFLFGSLFLPFGWALVPAVLVALSPHLVAMGGYILTETLFSVVLTTAVGLFCLALRWRKRGLFVLAGLMFGLAYLVTPTVLFLPFLLALLTPFLLRAQRGGNGEDADTRSAWSGVLLAGTMLLVVGMWAARNHLVVTSGTTGERRALSTLTHGTYPGFVYESEEYKYYPYHEDPEQPEYSQSLSNFWHVFWLRVTERPLRYASWYLFEKPYYLWSWNILQGQGDVYVYPVQRSLYQTSALANGSRLFVKWLHPVVLLLTLAGCVITARQVRKKAESSRDWAPLVLLTTLLYFTLIYALFFPLPRYAVPLRPVLYLFAVWVALSLSRATRGARPKLRLR